MRWCVGVGCTCLSTSSLFFEGRKDRISKIIWSVVLLWSEKIEEKIGKGEGKGRGREPLLGMERRDNRVKNIKGCN